MASVVTDSEYDLIPCCNCGYDSINTQTRNKKMAVEKYGNAWPLEQAFNRVSINGDLLYNQVDDGDPSVGWGIVTGMYDLGDYDFIDYVDVNLAKHSLTRKWWFVHGTPNQFRLYRLNGEIIHGRLKTTNPIDKIIATVRIKNVTNYSTLDYNGLDAYYEQIVNSEATVKMVISFNVENDYFVSDPIITDIPDDPTHTGWTWANDFMASHDDNLMRDWFISENVITFDIVKIDQVIPRQ